MQSIKLFRGIGLVEGITTLLLFFVAMPLKYGFGLAEAVSVVGMIHGMAFLAYIATMLYAVPGKNWSALDIARTLLAAFFPFGTFLNDGFLKRKQALAEQQQAGRPA